MTGAVIWETPENAGEYADVPCERGRIEHWPGQERPICGISLWTHHGGGFDHPWRIYRDATEPREEVRP